MSIVLENDQPLATDRNNNRNTNRTSTRQEERYVEQERPINSYIGLALLASLIFPPVGE